MQSVYSVTIRDSQLKNAYFSAHGMYRAAKNYSFYLFSNSKKLRIVPLKRLGWFLLGWGWVNGRPVEGAYLIYRVIRPMRAS